jgi:hypothetical protein
LTTEASDAVSRDQQSGRVDGQQSGQVAGQQSDQVAGQQSDQVAGQQSDQQSGDEAGRHFGRNLGIAVLVQALIFVLVIAALIVAGKSGDEAGLFAVIFFLPVMAGLDVIFLIVDLVLVVIPAARARIGSGTGLLLGWLVGLGVQVAAFVILTNIF